VQSLDILAATIVGIALVRGLFRGLVREAGSLAALAAAAFTVWRYAGPAGDWLARASAGGIPAGIAPWVAGAVLATASVALVSWLRRRVQRGLHAAGLGLADRAGGALLGAALGLLLVCLIAGGLAALLGRDHPWLEHTRSLAALERAEVLAGLSDPARPDVAAPPRDR
jgi:membrane protein required for colicin V production